MNMNQICIPFLRLRFVLRFWRYINFLCMYLYYIANFHHFICDYLTGCSLVVTAYYPRPQNTARTVANGANIKASPATAPSALSRAIV